MENDNSTSSDEAIQQQNDQVGEQAAAAEQTTEQVADSAAQAESAADPVAEVKDQFVMPVSQMRDAALLPEVMRGWVHDELSATYHAIAEFFGGHDSVPPKQ